MTIPSTTPLHSLYPELTPYRSFYLTETTLEDACGHQVYVECCGNPEGIPVLFLHGGPGSGCRSYHRRYFDPEHYHIILFDQRGCGRSRPLGLLTANTTQHLIADMEAIRHHLAIEKWLLFAGSWGSTLALSYGRCHHQHVLGLILRGVFLGRQHDIDWVYQASGAARLFPQQWQQLMQTLSIEEQADPLIAFQMRLHHSDPVIRRQMAETLYRWQGTIGRLQAVEIDLSHIDETQLLAHFQIQLHYALAQCFIADKPILSHLDLLQNLPTWIIQGQYDLVCPTDQAFSLHQALPSSTLYMLHLAGHMGDEEDVIHTLVQLMNDLKAQFASHVKAVS